MNENLSSSAISSRAARKQNNSSYIQDERLDSQVSNSLRHPMLAQYRNRSPTRIHRGILDSDSSDEAENITPSRSKQPSQEERWFDENTIKQEEQNKKKSFSPNLASQFSASINENKPYQPVIYQVGQPKENTMEDKQSENVNSISLKSISEINQSVILKEPEKRSKAPRKLSTIQSNRNITEYADKHNKAIGNNKNHSHNNNINSNSVLSSLSSSSKSDSSSDEDHYESVKVQMHPFNKNDILKYSSRKPDQQTPEITEIKIPKQPSFLLSPDNRQSQSRSIINSPTRGSSPLQRSGRYIWILNIGLVSKIKVLFSRLGKATSFYRTSQLNSSHLDLIGDLSIMREIDEKERKAQQKLVNRFLNSYMVFPTFNPYSIYKMTWDMLMLFLMVFLFFAIPLILSFGVDFSDLFGDFPYVMLSFFLFADALVNANTGFYKNGALVESKYMVFRNYAKKILFIDVFGITPLLIYTLFPSSTSKLFLFLYAVKYKSITKIFKRIELRLDLKTSLLNKIALLKLLFIVLFIAHLFANFWIMLPQFNSSNNWFKKASVNNEAWYIQYVTAFYYITVTMVTVGYGDITPSNYVERFFSIITILLSCAVFAYSVSSVGFILEEINREQKNLNKNMQVINSYMDQKNISRELRYQIREYLEIFWRQQNAGNVEQEQQIITQLAYNLKQKLFVEANKLILKDNKIFSGRFSERVLMKTLQIVKEYKFTPQQVIFEKNQSDDSSIYFIENGNVQIFFENEKTAKTLQIKNLGKGDYFGEIGFYTGQERSMSVKSLGFATLLKIDREDFLGILKQFPKDEELFNLIKDQIIFCQGFGQNGTNCYACKSGMHLVSSCPMVQFVPNKMYCYGRYNYNPGQSREFLERSKRVKNSSLKDIELVQEGVENIQDNYPDLIENTQSSESEENISYFEDSFNGFAPEGNQFYYENETEDNEQFTRQFGENLNRIKSNSDSTNGSIQRGSNGYLQQQLLQQQQLQQQQQQIYPKSSFFNISQQNPQSSFVRDSINGFNSNLNENSIINEINEDSADSDSQQDIRINRRRTSSSNTSRGDRRNSQLKDPPNILEIRNKLKRACQIELDNSLLDKLNLNKSRSKSLSQKKIKLNPEEPTAGSLNNSNTNTNNNNILSSLATIKSIQNLPNGNEESEVKLSDISLKEKRSSKISDNTKDTTTSNRSSSGIFAIKRGLSESDRESSKITTDPDRTSISIPRNSLNTTNNEKNGINVVNTATTAAGAGDTAIKSPEYQVKGRVFTFDRTFNSVKQNSSCNIPENSNAIYGQDQLNQLDNDNILNQQLQQLNQKGSFGCMGMIQSKQLQLLQQQILMQNSLSQQSSSSRMSYQQQLSSGRNSSSVSSPWLHEETPRFFARSRSSLATNTLSSPRDSVQFSYNNNNNNNKQRQSCFCQGNSSPQCMNNLRGLCMMMPRQSRQFNQADSILSSNRSSAIGQLGGGIRSSNIRRQDSVFLPNMPNNMNNTHKQSLCSSRKSSQKNNSRGSSDENNNNYTNNNYNIFNELRSSSTVIDSMQKKITAIYDKLIAESITEQSLDSPLNFDKQQDYMIYFPTGNLSAVLSKRKVQKKNRSPNHTSKLTHFILNQGSRNTSSSFNQIQTSEEIIKLSKTPSMMMAQMGASQQYQQMKSKNPVIQRLHSSFNVSPKSRSQLQKKLNTLIVPQKMSEDSQDLEVDQSEKSEKSQEVLPKLYLQLQPGKRSSSIFRPRESLEIQMSPKKKKDS